MRTLALALAAALPVWLAAPAAQALCITGVECIRERFGQDATTRNNRIIDRTDRLGDRGRPLNPYVANRSVLGQARRAGRIDSTLDVADPSFGGRLVPGEVGPDVRYAPESALGPAYDPYSGTPAARQPGLEAEDAADLGNSPYQPALPATGETGAASPYAGAAAGGRSLRPAAPVQRDRNRPQDAADLRYGGPRSSGAYR